MISLLNRISKSLLCGLLISFQSYAGEEPKWELTGQGSDYMLYRKPSAGSSDLVAFRIVGTLHGSPVEVATAILDREHRLEWMRDVRVLKTVRIPAPGTVIEYTEVKTPFIIKDRDFVIQTSVEVDLNSDKIKITSQSLVDDAVPETSRVRGALSAGTFLIEPGAEQGTSKLTADMDVDPKGAIPNWIVNKFQKNWPAGMFRSLTHFLKRKVAVLPEDLKPLFFNPKKGSAKSN